MNPILAENTMEPFEEDVFEPADDAINDAINDATEELEVIPAAAPKKTRKRAAGGVKKEEPPVCPICCETYNKSLRAPITCSYEDCHYMACKTCVRTYLTSTIQEPHCMNCKKPFEDEFMFKHLNRSYCKTDFRDHRRKILFDIEVSKIPETIPAVENFLKIEEYQNDNLEISDKISELEREIRNLERNIHQNNREIDILRGAKPAEEKRKFIMACPNEDCRGFLSTSYKCEICKYYTCPHCLELTGKDRPPRAAADGAAADGAAEDNYYKEPEEGDGADAPEHVCNPDCVKNAEAIKKDTRACPSCGTRIYKIEGCSQIWCTSCHVAFDWNTGRIDNGVIHNPHFFEWQRKGGGAARVNGVGAEAAAAAGGGPCGGMNNYRVWDNYRQNMYSYGDRWIQKLNMSATSSSTTKIIPPETIAEINRVKEKIFALRSYMTRFGALTRTIEHVANVIMAGDRRKIQALENHETTRVLYILKRISDEDFANIVYKNSVQRKKLMEKYHVFELLTTVGREWYNSFSTNEDYLRISNEIYYIRTVEEIDKCVSILLEQCQKKEEEFIEFIKYCNDQFYRLAVIYGERAFGIEMKADNSRYDWYYRAVTPPAKSKQGSEKNPFSDNTD